MKNYYLIGILCLMSLAANAQWVQRNPLQTSYINNISVVDDNVIWLKDQYYTAVSISTDGGENWVKNFFPTSTFSDCAIGPLSAVSATTAYVVATGLSPTSATQNGVYKTTNGGVSWSKLSGAFSSSSFPNFIYFWNENEGVTIGDAYPNQNFEIYTTSNGGTTWTAVPAGNMPSGNYEWSLNSEDHMSVVDGVIYFTTSGGRIFKSTDKGNTWGVITTPATTNNYMSFDFANLNNGMVVVSNSAANDYHVYTTTNAGASWTEQFGTNYFYLRKIKYDAVHNVYLSTHSVYGLMYSTDNGVTWTRHPSLQDIGVGKIKMLPSGRIIAGGWGSVFLTNNYTGVNPSINSVFNTNNKITLQFSESMTSASATNLNNYLIRYRYSSGMANVLDTLQIASAEIDPSSGGKDVVLTMASNLPLDTILVNAYNVVSNSGWQVLYPTYVTRSQIQFVNSTNLPAWIQRNSLQTTYIDNVSVVNNNVIWVTDQTDTSVSVSTDGGETWSKKNYPTGTFTGSTLGTLSAVSATTAYTVSAGLDANSASSNGVYKTTDGGTSWTKLPGAFSAASFPNFVYFWNENEGVAIGDAYPNQNFEIYTTTNGGTSWTVVPSSNMPSGNYEWGLNSGTHISVVDEVIYFTTSGGRIFKSTDKGNNWSVITTPLTSNTNMSFDFASESNGMVVLSNSTTNEYKVYVTANGGANWTEQTGGEYWYLKYIKYDAIHNVYFSSNSSYGLAYSTNNGATWTRNPSFVRLSTGKIAVLPNGRIFAGGWGSVFMTDDYTGVNPTVSSASSESANKISLYFSDNITSQSAAAVQNYLVTYSYLSGGSNVLDTLQVSSAELDASDAKKIVLTMSTNLPLDTITINTRDIMSSDGWQVLFPSVGSRAQFVKTNTSGFATGTVSVLNFYPNPAQDVLYVSVDATVKNSLLKIYSITGQKIMESKMVSSQMSLPLNMEKGIYMVELTDVQTNQRIATKRLIKD